MTVAISRSKARDHTLLLWVVLGFALAVRLIWASLISVEPVSDSFAYQTFAENLVNHGVYAWEPDQRSAYWPVGTSAILAGAYMLFGINDNVVVGLNLIASVGSIALIHYLGNLYFGRPTGIIAAALLAAWPLMIQYTTIISSELFFIFLTLLSLACWERTKTAQSQLLWLVAAGVAFAAATYVRPIALLLPIALALFEVLRGETGGVRAMLRMVGVMFVMAALIAPWSYRNYTVFGEKVLISTNFGANFWMGNNPNTTGGYQPLPERVRGLSEVERSAILEQEAKDFIADYPILFLQRTLVKAVKLHDRETIGAHWNQEQILKRWGELGFDIARIVPTLYWYAMLALAFMGMILLARTYGFWLMLLSTPVMFWGYVTAVHAIIVIQDRYHSPSIPFVCMLAASAVAVYFKRRRSSHIKSSQGA